MFLFKCCSNHSLPNFLKSSKSQPSPNPNQASITTPNFQGRCSDEAVNDFNVHSAKALDDSVDVAFGKGEVKKESAEDSGHGRRESSDGYGRKIVIKSLRKSPVEIRSSSSNSIVLLVGDNRVKTKLLKHIQSNPCAYLNHSEIKSTNIERKPFTQSDGNILQGSPSSSNITVSESCIFDESNASFMFKNGESVYIDHAEFILTRFPINQRIEVDEFQTRALNSEQPETNELPNFCEVVQDTDLNGDGKSFCSYHHADYLDHPTCSLPRGNNDVPQDLPLIYSAKDSALEEILDRSNHNFEIPDEQIYYEKTEEQSSNTFNDTASVKADDHSVSQNLDDAKLLENAENIQELDARDFCETLLSQTEHRKDFNRNCLLEITEERVKAEIDKPDDLEVHPSKQLETDVTGVTSLEDNVAAVDGIHDMVSGLCNNSSPEMIFAGETASFLEEFLPREGYMKPTEFSDLPSPTTSEDSTKNVDELTTSNDSLLSNKSFAQIALRPCNFPESQVMFSNSPENNASDESIQSNSENNSATDSLLESPESPGDGLDFRHFYSKSLPNLDRQPYDSMSSLSIIEEYFNRYIIKCGSDDSRQGPQVVPQSDNVSDESDNFKVCFEDRNRHHSLEKLTEICKKFSSTYLNFLHSNRSDLKAGSAVDQSHENPLELQTTDAKGSETDNSAGALTHGALALYAAIFPHPDSKEFAHAKIQDNGPEVVNSSIKTSLAGRSVSLRETSGPGVKKVPKKKKVVKFADSFGLELAIVRLILSGENLSDQDFQQRFQSSQGSNSDSNNSSSNNVDNASENGRSKSTKAVETRNIVAAFIQPETSDEFMQRLEAQKIVLESCLPEEKSRSVSGCIRVKNLSYEKTIVVRYTLNEWLSYNEAYASYVYGSNDGHLDRFSFSIKLPSFFDIGSSIEFAIMYRTRDGIEYWDNNSGCNYRMICQKC